MAMNHLSPDVVKKIKAYFSFPDIRVTVVKFSPLKSTQL
ncbi:Uncharacterized protein dnm_031480 [Desulfonema magnum]|uniref:Uncharacterized protein n=1 Tax=Desulfonema magnum TaxID=45655 RepID=A0A975GMV7_9BACT|nr:Uncharacterized protein dnm_031480 [Desulfonema magnum]